MSGGRDFDGDRWHHIINRRAAMSRAGIGLGSAAASWMMTRDASGGGPGNASDSAMVRSGLHHRGTARRVIYLFMGGGPSQMEMLEHKPMLARRAGEELPESIRDGQRLTTMTSGQSRLPIAPSAFAFSPAGRCGHPISELLPQFRRVIDDVTVIHSVHTDAINHDPAMTFVQTGHELPGRPAAGAWVSYGLGSENENLPTYAVLHSKWSGKLSPQPIFARLWGNGFLPSRHQGVGLRGDGDPVLYLSNPAGVDRTTRRIMIDGLNRLNAHHRDRTADPEIETRMAGYEMAFRMQSSVPELTDIADEPADVTRLYGSDCLVPGTFAANCLLARRMAQRGVRFTQIFHRGWDQHGNLPKDLPRQCGDIDRAMTGLILDLKRCGLLDDTLVVWGGEFGRTVYCQGDLTANNYGRDHHPRCFTMWMAGGGIRAGFTYGRTDEFGYNIVENPVHVHDINATILHALGIDHRRLTHRYQGRDFRLTDVHGNVIDDILA